MAYKGNFIGKWVFNYWPARNKSSVLTIMEDGTASTTNGTWYQWEVNNYNQISIFNDGYVLYKGVLNGDYISGIASSEFSGNQWEWNAYKHILPLITPILGEDLSKGWWTLRNEIDEVDDNIVEFHNNGNFVSKNYSIGTWSLSKEILIIYTANGFLKYEARCEDGVIRGKCRNQLGIEWPFRLEHTYVPITPKPRRIHSQQISIDDFYSNNKKKHDSKIIINYLEENGIQNFYHFTSSLNIPSIKTLKGLYSWKYLVEHGIAIPDAGGNEWSRELDLNEGLEDYVRLSFCENHPMAYRKKSSNLVLLKIDIEVASFWGTLFSDINAASHQHKHGGSFSDLKRVDLAAVKKKYVSKDDQDYRKHQAEVMVKSYVPQNYIINLNQY